VGEGLGGSGVFVSVGLSADCFGASLGGGGGGGGEGVDSDGATGCGKMEI